MKLFALTLALGLSLVGARMGAEAKSSDAAKECSGALYTANCKDLSNQPLDLRKSTSEADGVLFNYFLFGKREHYYELLKFNSSAPPELGARASEISGKVRAAAISYVTGSEADEKKWSPEIAGIVQRLRTVRIQLADRVEADCLSRGDPGIPYAVYAPGIHTITVCPGMIKSPTEAIASAVAHELGHAVSPCAMKDALIEFKDPTPEMGACLLKTGVGENRSIQDREDFGPGPLLIPKQSDYGTDLDPVRNNELIKCGAAVRLPSSELKDAKVYRSFNACTDSRYKEDYENWISFKLFDLERMPKFDKLPSPAREEWPKRVEELRSEVPFRCFDKVDEHFADSFGGMVFSKWGEERNLTRSQFEIGIHNLTSVQCIEKVTKRPAMREHGYPPISDRIALFLKPRAISSLVNCKPPRSGSLCALTEETFAPSILRRGSEDSGTRR